MNRRTQRNQLLRLFNAYQQRLERLYDEFVDELTLLDYGESLLETDALFNFDNFPRLAGTLNEIFASFVNRQVLSFRGAITSAVALAYEHDNSILSGFSVLSNAAVAFARGNAAEAFIRGRMEAPQGLNLSQLVWNYSQQSKSEFEVAISNVISEGLQQGTSAEELGRKVRGQLNDPDMMWRRYHENVVVNGQVRDVAVWRKRVIDENGNVRFIKAPLDEVGTGTYRSARKNANRLMRSEINMAYHRANHDRWMQEPFIIGQRISLSPQHPRYDICDELKGDYPKEFLFIGWHPQCLCMSNPITLQGDEKKDYYRRLAMGEDMSNYVSPNRIKDVPQAYKDYVAKNADKIVAAEERGKLAWHLAENRQYWENIVESNRTALSEDEARYSSNAPAPGLVAQARRKYNSYDDNWTRAYFNSENGGFNVYHNDHLFSNVKPQGATFTGGGAEKEVGRILADSHAKQVEYLPEKGFDGKKADMRFDDASWDVKYIPKANVETIRKYIKNGSKAENVIFFWDEKNRLHDLKNAVDRTIGSQRSRGKIKMPNIYYIGEDRQLHNLYKKETDIQ